MFLVLAKLFIVGRNNVSLNAFFFLHQKKNSVLTLGHWTNNSAVCLSFLLLKQKHLFFFFNTTLHVLFFVVETSTKFEKKNNCQTCIQEQTRFFFCEQFSNFEKQFCRTTSTKANFTPKYVLNVFTLRIMSFYPILMLVHSFFRIFFIL